jgi:hypothetical protein
LTDWLRGRSDAELAELLRRRPDLALPAPADLPALASRLSVRTSVQRAVDGLDAHTLHVLEALVLAAQATGADERAVTLADAAPWLAGLPVEPALETLRILGLVWGADDALRLVATVRDSLGPYPAGLGRPASVLFAAVPDVTIAAVLRRLGLTPATQPGAGAAVAAQFAPDEYGAPSRLVSELLDATDSEERAVLHRLAAGPPVGVHRTARVTDAPDTGAGPDPVTRLLRLGLLVPVDAQTVELPREIALALRTHPLGPDVNAAPPPMPVRSRDPEQLDRLGGTAVLETLRLVTAIGAAWSSAPPPQLRAGGLGVRDLRRLAHDLDVDDTTAALLVETAAAAGLLASTTGMNPVYLPTAEYDVWLAREPARQWVDLASAWLAMPRQPSLVSERGERDRLITALGPDAERGTAAALRARVLDVVSALQPGSAPSSYDAVLARLAWETPRRARAQRSLAAAVLAEADLLGITVGGGLTGYSRTLRTGSRAVAEQVLASALPVPVDEVLVQPDLTVVVPGPPTRELAEELSLTADLESSGGASVYRITATSVRRALDAGRSGTDVLAMLTERSRTPVPQALTYLVEDSARRHGVLRSGSASAYLRCTDEALLRRVLAERDVASLELVQIAPTVAISPVPAGRLLDVLRAAGFAPAAETPDGGLLTLNADAPRAPSRPAARLMAKPGPEANAMQLRELVRRIRDGDALTELTRRSQPVSRGVPGVTSATTMGLLRSAIRGGQQVWLGMVGADGSPARHLIVPISMGGGFVRGHEKGRPGLQSYPLHRLTAVHIVADAETDTGGADPA